jgi:hypothetical protein
VDRGCALEPVDPTSGTGPGTTWRDFVERTRPRDPEDDGFARMARVLARSSSLTLARLRQAQTSPWYGPAGFFVAGLLLAMLPTSTPAASWTSSQDAWLAIGSPPVLATVGLLCVATFATQLVFVMRERQATRQLIDAQSTVATALLFVAAVLWLIAIVFAIFSIAAALLQTVIIIGIGLRLTQRHRSGV